MWPSRSTVARNSLRVAAVLVASIGAIAATDIALGTFVADLFGR